MWPGSHKENLKEHKDTFDEDNLLTRGQRIENIFMKETVPILLKKAPQVLAITGDHSTPVSLKAHSWHPPPVLFHSPSSGSDKLSRFTEINANYGSLGIFQSKFLIRLMMANAGLYDKFGA